MSQGPEFGSEYTHCAGVYSALVCIIKHIDTRALGGEWTLPGRVSGRVEVITQAELHYDA